MKITAIKSEYKNIDLMLREVVEKYGSLRTGIIIVFDDASDMHTLYYASSQELALASVRLAQLSNKDIPE